MTYLVCTLIAYSQPRGIDAVNDLNLVAPSFRQTTSELLG